MTQVNNTRQHLRVKESERFLVRSLDLLIGFRIIHESQSYLKQTNKQTDAMNERFSTVMFLKEKKN